MLERKNEDEWFALFGIDRAVALPPDFEGRQLHLRTLGPYALSIRPHDECSDIRGACNLANRKLRLTRSQFKDHAFIKRLHPRSLRRRIA